MTPARWAAAAASVGVLLAPTARSVCEARRKGPGREVSNRRKSQLEAKRKSAGVCAGGDEEISEEERMRRRRAAKEARRRSLKAADSHKSLVGDKEGPRRE